MPPGERPHFYSLAAAALAHLAVMLALLPSTPEALGDHGMELEAIAVSVVGSIPRMQSAGEADAVDREAPRDDAAPPEAEKKPDEQRPPEQQASLTPPEPQPDAEREQVVEVPERPIEEKRELTEEPPKPEPKERQPQQQQAAPSIPPASAAAAQASVGAMQAYARQLVAALAKAKPKGTGAIGTVKVRFVVEPGGQPVDIAVVTSSGKPKLDQIAVAAIAHNKLPQPPDGASQSQRTFVVPYDFR